MGDLIIEVPIVSPGYLKDSEWTAAAFIYPMQWLQHLRGNTKPRAYRKRGLIQPLPAEDLRFVGRTDHQVKLRGQQVELDEVENVLRPLSRRATNVIVESLRRHRLKDQAFLSALLKYTIP
jgi:non-ribosomal peptide synthetase component F